MAEYRAIGDDQGKEVRMDLNFGCAAECLDIFAKCLFESIREKNESSGQPRLIPLGPNSSLQMCRQVSQWPVDS